MAITQKEIAARAGVSCATVSRVIREPQAVRPHLANRVLAAMRELGLEIKGTELVPERSIHILVVVNDLTYSLYGGFIAGISEATNERGLSLVLCNSQGDLEVEKNAVSTSCRGGYIGIIFVTAEDTADYRELLRHISIPIVFLNRKIEGLDHDSVLLSHFETARIATRYLTYLKQIDKISSYTEQQLHKSMRNKELIQLLGLEKSLVYFSTSLKGNEVTLEKILRGRIIKLYEEDQDLLEDVLVEVKQAIEMCNIYTSILSGTMDAFASVISNNLNIVMKILASVTIVMSIPTIVSSFYGMNIGGGMPLDQFWWFPVALSIALAIGAAVILVKKDMFH